MFLLRVIAVGAVVVWSASGAGIIAGDARRGGGPLRAPGVALHRHAQYDALSAYLGSAIRCRRVKKFFTPRSSRLSPCAEVLASTNV